MDEMQKMGLKINIIGTTGPVPLLVHYFQGYRGYLWLFTEL